MQCGGLVWKTPSNHLYFQLGNGLLLLAFLSPNSLAGMLWLRCLLAIGCVLLIMWGWLIECSIDIVLWFGLFLLINLLHSIVLIVRLRPIKFEKEIEAVSGGALGIELQRGEDTSGIIPVHSSWSIYHFPLGW